MAHFKTFPIADGAHGIIDAGGNTFYLVEGESRAAVIDTGITEGGRILAVIRSLTEKPVILILTHAHIDHIHHMDEFDTVYLCHTEFTMPEDFLQEHKAGKDLKLEETLDIRTGSVIDLGGRKLEIFQVPGHTPGSVAIFDEKEKLVFTGDAVGSGAGVWMQLPGRSRLEEYAHTLGEFLVWLLGKGTGLTFWPGHYEQRTISQAVPGENPLSLGLIADLRDLAVKLSLGQIRGTPVELPPHVSPFGAAYAAYGRGEMIYSPQDVPQP